MKLRSIIVKGILVVLLVVNIATIAMGEAIGSSVLNKLPIALLPVVSDSMKPLLKSGDAIVTKNESFENLKVGDIVVYGRNEELIVHQIIDRDEKKIITKGLSNEGTDDPVFKEEYRAKMVFKVPLLGGIWRLSSKPVGFTIFVILVTLLIFGDLIFEKIYTRFFDKNE